MLRGVLVIAACLVAGCGAQSANDTEAKSQVKSQVKTPADADHINVTSSETSPKAEPPKINSGFLKKIFFRDVTDSKTLDCTADGIPPVEYEWHRNGVKIIEQPGTVEVTGGRLQLLKPTINDEGFYQCFATNKHGKSMSTVVEMQKAQLLGYKTLPVANIGTHDAGSHVTLTCRDQPMSVPTAVYGWYIGRSDAMVTGGRIVIDQVGDLHFINVEVGDELVGDKTYNCSLYNVVAQLRVYGSPTKFRVNPVAPVQRAPSVVWYTDSESSVALLGKTVTLQCIPDGYPLPKIEWSKTGGSLPVERHIINEDKYTLEISNVTEADEGTYTCTAVHGSQRSPQNIFVDVKSEPIWEEKLKSLIVTAGKDAEFRCVARSAVGESDNPLVTWYQNGKPLNAGATGKITVSGTKLTVTEVRKPYDLMNIQCNVSNSIGYQLADAFLNVIDVTRFDVEPKPKYLVDPGDLLEVPIMAVADPLYHRHLTYRWTKNGGPVSKNPTEPVYVDVSNTLIINATKFEREQRFLNLLGNYSCLVSMGLEKGEGDRVVSTLISSDEEEAKAEPPKINSGFLKKIFFRDVTDSKTLDCTADGIPPVEYEWHRNGVKIIEQPGTVEVTGGRLQLLKPTINDEGFYQCFATNKHGKSMSTVVEMQKAQLLGYKTLPVANIGTHDAGSHVTLTCRDQPMSVPTAVYGWYIGRSDAMVTGGRIVIDQVGDLHFINVEVGDELVGDKTYSCSLYNVVAQLRVYGSPTKFRVNPVAPVQRAPSVVWYTDSESSVALLGKTVTLQCIPDGYPLPKIEWSRNGGSLPVERHIISDDKYTLEISNVTEADEGAYTCTAVHGSQRSPQNIFVDVKSEPIWEEKLKSLIVTAGKDAEFRCVARSAVGESDNALVTWYQNGKPLNAGATGKITVSGTKLTVTEVRKPYDLMNIQCNVSNSIGYQLADAFLNVIDVTRFDVEPKPKYLVDPGDLLEVPIMAVADPLYHRHLTYRWTKNGGPVSKNPTEPVYVDVSNTLIINATKFEREQRFLNLLGNYSCLVSMGLEKGEGDRVVSTLISSDEEEAKAEPPKINSGFLKKIFFRDVTDSKTLDCTADGIPPVEYEWHRNGVKIIEQPGTVEVTGGRLQLLKPTINDEGFYQCFATNKHGKSMSTVVEMQKAQLLGYKTLPVANIGTHDAGSHVTLTCRDQPMSVPTAVYGWYIGRSDAMVTGGRIVIDQVGDLHFINVEVGDELVGDKTYSYSLYNVVAQLRVYGSPTKFRVNPVAPVQRAPSVVWYTDSESSVALLGKTVTLQCIPDGYPLPKIEWSRTGGSLPVERHIISDDKYTLEISNVTEADEGTYTCTAVHGSQRSPQNIFVDVKSEPIWKEKLKSLIVTAGKDAEFRCVARSAVGESDNPLVTWYQNGKPLNAGATGKITVSGTKLTVTEVRKPYDLMNIQCNVSNSIGYQLADAFLNVIDVTRFDVEPKPKYLVDPGDLLEVPIMAVADPLYHRHLTYRWTKNGGPVSKNPTEPVYVDVSNTLIINATKFEREQRFLNLLGNYSCLVSMGLEKGEGDRVVSTLISSDEEEAKAEPPKINSGFLKKIFFRDVTDSKTLDCTADGIPPVEYEWHRNGVKIIEQPGTVEVTGGRLQLLKPTINDEGFYQCFATNKHGKSMSTVVEMQKAQLLGYKTLPVANIGTHDAGSHVTLTCRDQPMSVPTAVYGWYIGRSDAMVTGGRIVIDQVGDLHFMNVEVGDELVGDKTYSCSLYNVVAQLRVYGSPTKFRVNPVAPVQRAPSVVWYTDSESSVALLGKTVTLQCIPDGYPLPKIEWSKTGGSLPVERHIINDDKYTLEISNVTEADEGTYTCTAVYGSQRSPQNIFVDVKSEPIWEEKLKSLIVTAGKDAEFRCVARSAVGESDNPLVTWYQNGKPLNAGATGKITVSGTKLTVTEVRKPYDLMNIQCNVSNSIGYQLADAFLNVIDVTRFDVEPKPKYLVDPGDLLEVPIMAVADPLYHRHLTYRWTKNGGPVSKNPTEPVYVDVSNTLIINATKFEREQRFLNLLGNYSCLVSMGLEKGEGDRVVSTLISSDEEEAKAEPPKINSGFLKKIFFRDVTDSKTLDCTADGIPPVEYEWHQNGVKIIEQPGTVEVTGGRLQLLKPTINDEGFYQCFATNKHGKSMSTVVEMQKAQLLGYKTLPVANIGTHDAGSHVTLTCRDQPMSVPTAVYGWYIGRSDAMVTGGRIVIDQVGDLHFMNVEVGDELVGDKTYSCSLYNVVAQLRVYGSPTKFRVNPVAPVQRAPSVVWYTDSESSVALLGKTVTLQCIPDGYPLPKIEWSRTGGSLPVERHIISDNKYTLEISNVTEADEGTYTCTAVHGIQRSPQNIFVDVKSEPIWEEKLKSLIVTAGKDAEFRCVARSAVGESDNPLVTWYQNGKPLNAGATGKITVSGTKLTVTEVRKPYDLMNIQCNVSNSIGYQLADAFLNVIDRTILHVKPEPNYFLNRGEMLKVPISALADPLYHRRLTYRWSKNGQAVSKNPTDHVYVDTFNTLIVNATELTGGHEFEDILGNYSCLVSIGLEGGEGDVVVNTFISYKEPASVV